MTRFKAIIPKRDPFRKVQGVIIVPRLVMELNRFALKSIGQLSEYPPKRGGSYIRKGNLGRRWTMSPKSGARVLANSIKVTIGNNADYGIWVQGPTKGSGKRQVKWAGERGWMSVTKAVTKTWPYYKRRLILIMAGRI